ncbi:MAG: hypothetical protein IJD92_02800 [Bacilli bacterium]|nr:hypothetical protein [Bacilli bacterium]
MYKKFVKYEDEKGNPFIEKNFTKLSPELYKLVNKNGKFTIEPILYILGPARTVNNLSEFAETLPKNETLIIEISDENLDKVRQENIYTYEDLIKKESEKEIENKIYLIGYETPIYPYIKSREDYNKFTTVALLKCNMADEDIYLINKVDIIDSSIKERQEFLQEKFGGYSALYNQINDLELIELLEDEIYEVTIEKDRLGKITKLPKVLRGHSKK